MYVILPRTKAAMARAHQFGTSFTSLPAAAAGAHCFHFIMREKSLCWVIAKVSSSKFVLLSNMFCYSDRGKEFRAGAGAKRRFLLNAILPFKNA